MAKTHDAKQTERAFREGEALLADRPSASRKALGQFLSPPAVARALSAWLGPLPRHARVLDPAAGSGVLAVAVIEAAVRDQSARLVHVTAYEVDGPLADLAETALTASAERAGQFGIDVHVDVRREDFLAAAPDRLAAPAAPSLFESGEAAHAPFDAVIANPPYFKVGKSDARVGRLNGLIDGGLNAYSLFMSASVQMLRPGGRAAYIVPRSFCSGPYFSAFRRSLLRTAQIERVHLFDSRVDTFDEVLQENVIVVLRRCDEGPAPRSVRVSSSGNTSGLRHARPRAVAWSDVAMDRRGAISFRLPTSDYDDAVIRTVERWPATLASLGLHAATGPVVAFRARPFLSDAVGAADTVPLLWMQNVAPGSVAWPVARGRKPQAIDRGAGAQGLLVPAVGAVVLRRFSSKEEARRLTCAPLLASQFDTDLLGFENHLNVITRIGSGDGDAAGLTSDEAVGLSAVLGSDVVDRFVRTLSGSTQVNAAELRALRLPPLSVIIEIGQTLQTGDDPDTIVHDVLRRHALLPDDLPRLTDTRIDMALVRDAQDALQTLGLPPAQQNEMAALTLLAFAGLNPSDAWPGASRPSLGIHGVLCWIREGHARDYAENTRETFRKNVVRPFVQAGVLVRNPDDPTLATNSPQTHYRLTDEALHALQTYGTPEWAEAAASFVARKGALADLYRQSRDQQRVPLRLPSGEAYALSPGAHNVLQAQIIEEFGPRFAPGAQVLYVGDTENKSLHLDTEAFRALALAVPGHDELPDVVLYDGDKGWLYLIEAVTSHGPISPSRLAQLRALMAGSSASPVYVTAFPDRATFRSYAADIAWETEVWIAEHPTHLVHFNGDRFLGPHVVEPAE